MCFGFCNTGPPTGLLLWALIYCSQKHIVHFFGNIGEQDEQQFCATDSQ